MIQNRDQLESGERDAICLDCLEAGIAAAHPRTVIEESVSVDGTRLRIDDETYDLSEFDDVLVLGGGKAGGEMVRALETLLEGRITDGVVVTTDPVESNVVDVLPGNHPVPGDGSVSGTNRLLELAREADEDTLVIAPISGGASAILCAPADGISLGDMQTVTDALLGSGASIHEINAVRKHLSAVKGGNLAAICHPGTIVGITLSDVVGNDLDVIASGPLVPDESTFTDALSVVSNYELDVPESVRNRFEAGNCGELAETPSPGDPIFDRVYTHLIADNFTAVEAAAETASAAGYGPLVLSSRIRGESSEAAKTHVAIAEEVRATGHPVSPPAAIVTGGETTVTITGDGTGGPNQEFALSGALELEMEGVSIASVDTDGIDGPTDAAGGLVDAETIQSASSGREALESNDVLPILEDAEALIRTGPTGTNVNDLRIVLIEES